MPLRRPTISGGQQPAMSKELLDFCQCSSGLLLTLHLFFGSIVCPYNCVLRTCTGVRGALKKWAVWLVRGREADVSQGKVPPA